MKPAGGPPLSPQPRPALLLAAAAAAVVGIFFAASEGARPHVVLGSVAAAGLGAGACAVWRVPWPSLLLPCVCEVVAYFTRNEALYKAAIVAGPLVSLSSYAHSDFVARGANRTSRVLAAVAAWLAVLSVPTLFLGIFWPRATLAAVALGLGGLVLGAYSAASERALARWIRRAREGGVPDWTATEVRDGDGALVVLHWQPPPTHYRATAGPIAELRVVTEAWGKVWLAAAWHGAARALLGLLCGLTLTVVEALRTLSTTLAAAIPPQ
jgi:hypothetical protein